MITILLKLHVKESSKRKVREQSLSVKFKIFTESDDGFIEPDDILKVLNEYSNKILQASLGVELERIFEGNEIPSLIRDSYEFNITVTPPDYDWKDTLIFEVTSENNKPYQGDSPSRAYFN